MVLVPLAGAVIDLGVVAKMWFYSKMAIKNLRLNWRHSVAAVMSVAVGFCSVVLFTGYISVVGDMYEDNYMHRSMMGHLIIERAKDGKEIDFEDSWIPVIEQQFVEDFLTRDNPVVVNYSRHLLVTGLANNGKSSSIFWGYGYDLKRGADMREPTWGWPVKAGSPLEKVGDGYAMVGQDLAETLGCFPEAKETLLTKVGGYDPVLRPFTCRRDRLQFTVTTAAGQLNAVDLKVGGIGGTGLRDIDRWYTLMALPVAQRLNDTKDVSHYRVQLRSWDDLEMFQKSFAEAALQRKIDLRAVDWRQHALARVYLRTMSMLNVFRNLVSAIIVTISGMAVLNAMVKNVSERLREIGTLRSIGFLRKELLWMFSCEGVVIGVVGCLVGTAISVVVSTIVNRLQLTYFAGTMSDPVPLLVGIVPSVCLMAAAILCGVSLLASYIAARRAVQLSIPTLLTSV